MLKKLAPILLLLSVRGWAANVTLNNSNTVLNFTSTTLNIQESVTAGHSNTCAFAIVGWDAATGATVSTVTYGGQTMTSVGTPCALGASKTAHVQLFYLTNPPTGVNTLGVGVNDKFTDIYVGMESFYNADQTTCYRTGTYQSSISSATAVSSTMTVTSDPTDLVVSAIQDDAGVQSQNQTLDGSNTGGNNEMYHNHSTTGASTVNMVWTYVNAATDFCMDAVSVKSAAAAAAAPVNSSLVTTRLKIQGAKVTVR